MTAALRRLPAARPVAETDAKGLAEDALALSALLYRLQRGYAWRRLPCGCHVVWDDRLGPMAPCRECDAARWRAWAVGCVCRECCRERDRVRYARKVGRRETA